MKSFVQKERLLVYVRIAGVFFVLSLIGDVIDEPGFFFKNIVNNLWLLLFLFVNNFILLEYSWPFVRAKWARLLIAPFLVFAHMMLYSFGLYAWRMIGLGLYLYFDLFPPDADWEEKVSSMFAHSMGSVLFFGIATHLYSYRRLRQMAQQLRLEKQEAELNYLKSQTNPHFLFNTLNNIYALAKDKSDLAPESILQLSKILRYMLYETSGAFIAIEQELKIIGDYIALEKLRYDESLRVNFNYDVEDMKQSLPPLLLIPLVENAFKHGVSETRQQPFVDIHLSVRQRQLKFWVKNSIDGPAEEGTVRENIGLANLRRQLELLYREYQLEIKPLDRVFSATLTINLASHV
jgi:hypothetical protein